MGKKHLPLALLALVHFSSATAQFTTSVQNFEPPFMAIAVFIDTTGNNAWQVGRPQKSVFDSAATFPNALVTDTTNTYPVNMNSAVELRMVTQKPVLELRLHWQQKFDFDSLSDGGMIEISTDSGASWENVLTMPSIGVPDAFDTVNLRKLSLNGNVGLTGTDTVWREVFLRFFLPPTQDIRIRFTAISDSIDNGRDGWMIDSFVAEYMYYISVNETETGKQLKVYPTVTKGLIAIESAEEPDNNEYRITVLDIQGKAMKSFWERSNKTTINIGDLPGGSYYLLVNTGNKTEVHRVVLSH